MNYRHIYHAGNFADVFKHIVLTRVIRYMQNKEAAFRVLDTHAGTGLYDLSSEMAQKTGEWRTGIKRVLDSASDAPAAVQELVAPYIDCVRSLNQDAEISQYPGSPRIARILLRKQDRLTALELHPDDFEKLQTNFAGDYQARVTKLDGWLGVKSHLPPKERRGIILIDPPFEVYNEFFNILTALREGHQRFATGTFLLWYPIKHRKGVSEFRDELKAMGIRNILDATLEVRTGREVRFDGSGMIVVNPPYKLEGELRTILPWLTSVLEHGPGAGGHGVNWLVREK
ncbi:23S rRNA (adenine(2030)-N(6))-methyltransferase RlmJ [Oricola cellulosilytica]|uniref:Ribosomal RNA large subunit methyltransferase J n=1 Tax=Oricola cellulosilytica TaxID=1429082 RepID=A0A4R0PD33_9HYPH|nr:23S rRNA (adenine(2030)-N(6))-methyltransferase RlmJ [Oricola cellulosilytica]TCD14328.1 23S rRNA (adenine(2030)-N(6))-methyltransferase RlmJ [Oricola cellulosilytica]